MLIWTDLLQYLNTRFIHIKFEQKIAVSFTSYRMRIQKNKLIMKKIRKIIGRINWKSKNTIQPELLELLELLERFELIEPAGVNCSGYLTVGLVWLVGSLYTIKTILTCIDRYLKYPSIVTSRSGIKSRFNHK